MKATVDFKTAGKLLEDVNPARRHRFLWTCGKIIENHIAGSGGSIEQLGLVDKGTFRNTVNALTPVDDRVVITDNVSYGIHLEYGTRPHTIKASSKKALHWKQDGKNIFAKTVHHPGTQAYRPFTKGLINSENDVAKKIQELVEENQ